jgi:DNA polymerase-3 subunit delta
VVLEELKKLKGKDLSNWMDKRLAALGKSATSDAHRRLVEIIGNDLRRLDNELQKIATFVAERKVIDIDDVHQVCDWVKTFIEWELADALERADYKESLLVLNRSFQEGTSPPYVVGILANFFRGFLLAKLWLKEGRDRKEIFAFLKPRIQENWNTYADKFRDLFSLIEGFSDEDLNSAIRELARIDLMVKTSDAAPQVLLEGFIYDYCRRVNRQREKLKSIWRGRG